MDQAVASATRVVVSDRACSTPGVGSNATPRRPSRGPRAIDCRRGVASRPVGSHVLPSAACAVRPPPPSFPAPVPRPASHDVATRWPRVVPAPLCGKKEIKVQGTRIVRTAPHVRGSVQESSRPSLDWLYSKLAWPGAAMVATLVKNVPRQCGRPESGRRVQHGDAAL